MEKPTIIKLKETEEEIVKIINNANLPFFVLKPVIEKLLKQVEILEQKELETETEIYNKALEEEKSKENKK